jgi:hypothetical protein
VPTEVIQEQASRNIRSMLAAAGRINISQQTEDLLDSWENPKIHEKTLGSLLALLYMSSKMHRHNLGYFISLPHLNAVLGEKRISQPKDHSCHIRCC